MVVLELLILCQVKIDMHDICSAIFASTYPLNASSSFDFPLRLTPVTTLISGVPMTPISFRRYTPRSISFIFITSALIIPVLFPKINIFSILEIESRKHSGSDPKAAPAASALFVCIEVRHQLQLREVLVGDFAELLQGAVGQLPQLGFVLVQVSAHFGEGGNQRCGCRSGRCT